MQEVILMMMVVVVLAVVGAKETVWIRLGGGGKVKMIKHMCKRCTSEWGMQWNARCRRAARALSELS